MPSLKQKADERGLFDKLMIFFIGKDGSRKEGFKRFMEKLLKSKKAIIVPVLGPSKSGKSTLLNFLTVKDYPLLNRYGKTPKKGKEMMYFKVQGGVDPCTTEFQYKKIKASEFMVIHGLKLPDNFVDYDIFFIDTEGFWIFRGVSGNFFLGLSTLLCGAGVLIYMDQMPMTNSDRIKSISQDITVSRFLGNDHLNTIFISRGDVLDYDDYYDDIDDDEYNEKVYKYFKEQDEKNKPIFISALKKKVVIDESKVSTLTMPRCSASESIAYKRVLNDLSKMILEGAVTCSGEELLEKIDRAYDKVRECKYPSYDRLSMDRFYNMLFNDFCHKIIEEKEREVLEEFNDLIQDKSDDELKEIQGGNNSIVNSLSSKPYFLFEGELKKIIPNTDALNVITRDFLEGIKRESEKQMKSDAMNEIKLLINIINDMKTPRRRHLQVVRSKSDPL